MQSSVVFRSYRPGDEAQILALFEEIGHRHSHQFWEWINLRCPFGETIFEVAEANGRIVGHYSVIPTPGSIAGRTLSSGLAIHAAVHPEFRNVTTIMTLCNDVYGQCMDRGLDFIYGFPNNNIWPIKVRLLDWISLGQITTLELGLSGATSYKYDSGVYVEEVEFLTPNLLPEVLSDAMDGLDLIQKDAAYLNWRYVERPDVEYTLLAARSNQDGKGYVVLKTYQKDEIRYGHIVDIGVSQIDHEDLYQALIMSAIEWAQKTILDVISCWAGDRAPHRRLLDKLGFHPTGFATNFGCRLLSSRARREELSLERWSFCMGDSDAF